MRRWLVSLICSGCAIDLDYEQVQIELEAVSPAMVGGGGRMVAASGRIMFGERISVDAGNTWATYNEQIRIDEAEALGEHQFVVRTTAFGNGGLGRWDMATDQVSSLMSPVALGVFHARPATETVLAAGPNAVMVRQTSLGLLTQTQLPAPTPTPTPTPEVSDIASTANVAVLISTWGLYRSLDDGASWQFVAAAAPGANTVLALEDGRFLVFAPDRTAAILDPAGLPTGITTAAFPAADMPAVACLGGVIVGDQFTRDLQRWDPLVPGTPPTPLTVSSYACGGSYLALELEGARQAWLMRVTSLGTLAPPLPYAPINLGVTDFVRAADGTVLVGDMAWRPGDPSWSIRPTPGARVHALSDGTLYAAAGTTVWRSGDAGVSWDRRTAPAPVPEAERFLLDGTTLVASRGDVVDGGYRARQWRSLDGGITWIDVFDKLSSDGIAPNLRAIDGDTHVATGPGQELYVSRDRGATWSELPFPAPYQLAFVTHSGLAVTAGVPDQRTDPRLSPQVWHLWQDYGLGAAYRQVAPTIGGNPISLRGEASFAKLDDDDRLYVLNGSPPTVFRSMTPLR